MKSLEKTLQALKDELLFVRTGGYRQPLTWRAPLAFEDSPRCPKEPDSACLDMDCALMRFVPTKCRFEAVPCRHIPLNEMGETLDSLYRTGTNEEIEQTLESWLLDTIRYLEEPFQQRGRQEAA
jgi:hypothetical protein